MTNPEVRERLAQGEDSRTQFKSRPIGIAHLAEELVAFSNAQGGVIFFGVDDKGAVIGLDRKQKKTLELELSNAANDAVRPSIYPRTEFHTIGGKQILAVFVSEGVSKPYADKKGVFWTKAGPDKRRITSREELQRLLQRSLLIHADELPVEKTSRDDLDYRHLGEFLERNYDIPAESIMDSSNPEIPQMLENLGFADGTRLTLAGTMLFAKNPQRFLPVNMVKAVTFSGNDVAGTAFRDMADINGTIKDMYEATMSFIRRNLRRVQVGEEFNQPGELEVPEEVLKELVVNMFLHRDYFVSAPWRVMVFDDRIELISPGALPNHLDIEKMKSGVSVARNPIIFSHATKEIPYRGLGTGVKRAIEICPAIRFENDPEGFTFKAVIPRGKTANASIEAKGDIGEAKGDIGNEKDGFLIPLPSSISEVTRRKVQMAYGALGAAEWFRRSDVESATGLAHNAAYKLLKKMICLGMVETVSGHGKGAYRFVSR